MPNINHEIIKWARETSNLTIEISAQKLQIQDGKTATAAEKLMAYEDGSVSPSRSMLLRMSKLYRRPLLTFYLDKPPIIGDRGEDFRTLPEEVAIEENAQVDALIRDIKARQSLVRDTLIDEDEGEYLDFVDKHTADESVQEITQTLRNTLQLDMDDFRSLPTYGDAFKLIRNHAEAAGIFVLLQGNLGSYHSNISVTAFRGFALSDKIVPFIIINDLDAKSAWTFTLLHEMAHIALGQTGISGAFMERKIEKFCNDVASEFLLPKEEFNNFTLPEIDVEDIAERVSGYAFSKKISSSHVVYRLYRRGDIDKKTWEKLRDYYHTQWVEKKRREKAKNKEKNSGPSAYVIKKYKLGALVSLVERFTYSGAISTTKVGMLLNVKPLKVHRLFESSQLA